MTTQISNLALIMKLRKEGTGARDTAQDLKATKNAADDAKQSGERLSYAWKAVEGVMIAAGAAFIKSVPAMVQQGVAIDRARTALEAYTGGAAEAEAALSAVQLATGGAIDEFSAMQNATRLFSMGLATNAEEVEKITRGAITLGAAMGKGPQQAFEEFTLLLANQSILRLDTFGISAGVVRQRMQELADEGISPADRQARFMIATMGEMDSKLGELDKEGFEATSSVDKLGAVITDTKNALSKALADGLIPYIDGVFDLREAIGEQTQAFIDAEIGARTYYQTMAPLKLLTYAVGMGLNVMSMGAVDAADISERLNSALGIMTEHEVALARAVEMGAQTFDAWNLSAIEAIYAQEELEEQLETSTLSVEEQAAALKAAGEASLAYIDTFDADRWTSTTAMTDALTATFVEQMETLGAAGPEYERILGFLDLLSEETADAARASLLYVEYQDLLTAALRDGAITADDAYAIYDDMFDRILEGVPAHESLTQAIDEMRFATSDAYVAMNPDALRDVDLQAGNLQSTLLAIKDEFDGISDTAYAATGEISEMPTALGDLGLAFDDLKQYKIDPTEEKLESFMLLPHRERDTFLIAIEAIGEAIDVQLNKKLANALSALEGILTTFKKLDGLESHVTVYVHTVGGVGGYGSQYIDQYITRHYRDAVVNIDQAGMTSYAERPAGGAKPTLGDIEFQHGGEFKVPAGFPNDSYFMPMKLTSDEIVKVHPPGYYGGEAGGQPLVANIYLDSRKIAQQIIKPARRQGFTTVR